MLCNSMFAADAWYLYNYYPNGLFFTIAILSFSDISALIINIFYVGRWYIYNITFANCYYLAINYFVHVYVILKF
jgi:hypothetical protein